MAYSMTSVILATACLLAVTTAAPTRVLFIGNSFTYVNDLPHTFQGIATSKGKEVVVDNSTIGGCTLFYQKDDDRTKQLLAQDWDYISLQDYSQLPTIKAARSTYMYPAVEFIAKQKKQAKILMYDTWGYINGTTTPCPTSGPAKCFPKGTLQELTKDCKISDQWANEVDSFDCMTYALARGYMGAFSHGADIVAPCGMAWEVARASKAIPTSCKKAIDDEYTFDFNITLPLQITGQTKPTKQIMLYRLLKHGSVIDKHPSPAGQYLNACIFYATIFHDSPVGAATITGVTEDEALGLQQVAAGVVLQHWDLWSKPTTDPEARR
jgi:hypothetical protein